MDLLDTYFSNHKYPLTSHQIDSYREFIRTYIPNIIKTGNPITMIKNDDGNEIKFELKIGSDNNIHIDRPIIKTDNIDTLLTPNEARLHNLTYQTNLYADIEINIYENNKLVFNKKFNDIPLSTIPIMVHSDLCILHQQNKDVLRELKECIYDKGGYFIIDGKEKVIVSQERITSNVLFITKINDDLRFSHKASISCKAEKGEGSIYPRKFEMFAYKVPKEVINNTDDSKDYIDSFLKQGSDKIYEDAGFDNIIETLPKKSIPRMGAIVCTLPTMSSIEIPIMMLFRVLGLENDEEIYHHIFGDNITEIEKNAYDNIIRPSFIHYYQEEQKDIYAYIDARLQVKRKKESIKGNLMFDLFPNISTINGKVKYLGYLVKEFILNLLEIKNDTDKDSYTYKRIDVSGILLADLFNETYDKFKKEVQSKLDNLYYYGNWRIPNDSNKYELFLTKDKMRHIIPFVFMSETFIRSLKGMWGINDDPELGIVQDLSRISYIGYLSHVRRINMPIDRSLKLFKPHRLHSQQWGIVCPYETPDGGSIGYLKNLAFLTRITSGSLSDEVMECLEDSNEFISLDRCNIKTINHKDNSKIFINGSFIGITFKPILLYQYLKICKRTASINVLTSISWNVFKNEIRILTESGRATRPLLLNPFAKFKKNWFEMLIGTYHKDIEYNENIYTRVGYKASIIENEKIEDFVKRMKNEGGIIEYLDTDESDVSYIAMYPKDFTNKHTYCEIHPSTIFSVVSANIPMCNHSFAARNIFHAAQSKQAIGIYATSFNYRFDTLGYIQHYPQRPIISTKLSNLTHSEDMPNGFNLIVAVMSYSGFNQEDSIMINRGAIERGLESISYYKSVSLTAKKESLYERTFFINPLKLIRSGKKIKGFNINADYSFLDDNGFVKQGIYIPEGKDTAVIGMVLEKEVIKVVKDGIFKKSIKEKEYIDKSFITDDNYYGVIDKVYISNKLSLNNSVCKIRFLKYRKPEYGDKHSSRHGQKGVIGRILDERDMPFTKTGLVPDIIMNPHAFPSRMTIGHIVECVFAKLCCQKGVIGNGSVFLPFDKEKMFDELQSEGYEKHGNEVLYNGFTGRQINTDIFIGPVYYFRLKHMVADKINARGLIGPKQFLTRQPTSGRRKHGGLKIGEMERDVLISHGLGMFLKESMMERSDKYTQLISKRTGTDAYTSDLDNQVDDYTRVQIPYSFKLLTQELETMCMQIHYNVYDEPINEFEHEIDKIQEIDIKHHKNTKKELEDKKEENKKSEKTCDDVKCPDDKICNPETLRCVKKDGPIGKKLIKKGGGNISEDILSQDNEDILSENNKIIDEDNEDILSEHNEDILSEHNEDILFEDNKIIGEDNEDILSEDNEDILSEDNEIIDEDILSEHNEIISENNISKKNDILEDKLLYNDEIIEESELKNTKKLEIFL
jgi:DNA-directed RNA polymerase II subunit RPB2